MNDYAYDTSGVKLRKIVTDGTKVTQTDYLGGFQYKNNDLQFFPTSEGYVNVVTNKVSGGRTYNYVYNYTDHLGNVRVSYAWDDTENKLEVLEENHYYPFGLKHTGYNDLTLGVEIVNSSDVRVGIGVVNTQTSGSDSYNYKFNGKELQNEFDINLYDYGARNYDPALGRWMNVDPLAEKMRRHSPYNYAFNNPVFFIDPDGMAPMTDYKLLQSGKVERVDPNDGSENDPTDTLYATNDDESINSENKIVVSKGSIGDIRNTSYFDKDFGDSGKDIPIQIIDVSSSNNSQGLFEFMAENSNSEFSITNFENGNIFIGTSFESFSEYSLNITWAENGIISSFDHSHPSWEEPSGDDSNTVQVIKESQPNSNPTFRIYHVPSKSYKTYDESGIELQGAIIIPRKK